ncbi:RING-H2 finger protein ATL79-like [Phoenix dactylifera]|uniref:RING-H2 finger protein ATL79-like n=1 Tax=Phoenix dactylifera TaxID=42345 RepID=A0A8B8ZBN0_PHODC|nr:RING-H2 finger protein ATL79-like [Phoenix dactylifera]
MPSPYHEDYLSSPPPPHAAVAGGASNGWGPYAGAGDFGASMLIILAALFVALVFALLLNAAIRFLFCAAARRLRRPHPAPADPEKQVAPLPAEAAPTLVFSAGTRLAGAEAECAICLAEFMEGERVRVLVPCNHGFHVRCIERWLAARSSCPTCRARCHVAVRAEGSSPVVVEA